MKCSISTCTFYKFRDRDKETHKKAPEVKEAAIFGNIAAHFKAFSVRHLKTESCSERLRVPFKTSPAPVNHSAFQPIPQLPF